MKSRSSQDYRTVSSASQEMSCRKGMVVRMLFPPNPDGKQSENPMKSDQSVIIEKSWSSVGHALRDGGKIVDMKGQFVELAQRSVTYEKGGRNFLAKVYDPGPHYPVCFVPDAPPQRAWVYKAPSAQQMN